MLDFHQRVLDGCVVIQILVVHIYTGDLAIFIGGVVIYACIRVAAAGVYGFFKSVPDSDATLLLRNRAQNMKELTDSVRFIRLRNGV